jgi:g-D-glutamyl-meso-diaminopimelate peptidase
MIIKDKGGCTIEIMTLGSTGPNVKLIQSLLIRLDYAPGSIDGTFGPQTQQAVANFQHNNRLTPDGVIGPITWVAIEKLLRGYDIYTVRARDNLNTIASKYYTTPNAIVVANPGMTSSNSIINKNIIIPFCADLVYNDIDYTYQIMERQIIGLKARYPFLEVGTIGKSILGKNLYYIRLGKGPHEVSYNASHHANESITTPLLMMFIERYAKAYSVSGAIRGYNISSIFNNSSIFVIPMVNPDGVDLVNYWPNYPSQVYYQAAQINFTGQPLPRVWKANIRGTDLNLNYPAEWDKEKQLELLQGITGPAPRDYGGPSVLSEPETCSMYNFTRQRNFAVTIAYHTQGQVIYYQFENLAPPSSFRIATLFAQVSGYAIDKNPVGAPYAGYKDWFIQDFTKPGFTIEVGLGSNPLPSTQLPNIYRRNEEILLLSATVK